MKCAAVVLLLLVVGAQGEARPLPRPSSLLDRPAVAHFTHAVRGDQHRLPAPRPPGTVGAYRPYQQTHAVRGK
jgi:hypothetical protein